MADTKDRFYIENYVNDHIVPRIDEKKFLGLGKGKGDGSEDIASRSELFLFAMAIGINEGVRTPLATAHGFILDTSLPGTGDFYGIGNAMSLIFSLALSELRKENKTDQVHDLEVARKIAQEYANTGFHIIEGWLDDKNIDEETIMNKTIAKMNRMASGLKKEES